MLIIPVKEGENIERALKKYKKKYDKTNVMNASTESLRVTVKEKIDPYEDYITNKSMSTYYSASNDSIHRRLPTGQYDDHDSLSLF